MFPCSCSLSLSDSVPTKVVRKKWGGADWQFLNQHCGTHRSAGGLLTDQAGKVLTLDTLASSFFSADLPSRSEVLTQAKEYVSSLGSGVEAADAKVNASASYYLKAMERVMEKGEAWVSKEQARYVQVPPPSCSLNRMDIRNEKRG